MNRNPLWLGVAFVIGTATIIACGANPKDNKTVVEESTKSPAPGVQCSTLGAQAMIGNDVYECKNFLWEKVVINSPTTKATKPPVAAKPVKPKIVIEGDTLVHIGEDAPAGTYRAETNVDGECYWKKSSDAEGSDIIDNGIPSGGRPQVTLKNGQWFTSERCPTWVKK